MKTTYRITAILALAIAMALTFGCHWPDVW